jgi:hypothetical protein
MDNDNDQKLLDRIAKLMDEQTIVPSKKELAAACNKYYAGQKKNKKNVADNAAGDEPVKKKRQPSAYNIFMKEQMLILKECGETQQMTANAKMQYIADLWKRQKALKDDEDVDADYYSSSSDSDA